MSNRSGDKNKTQGIDYDKEEWHAGKEQIETERATAARQTRAKTTRLRRVILKEERTVKQTPSSAGGHVGHLTSYLASLIRERIIYLVCAFMCVCVRAVPWHSLRRHPSETYLSQTQNLWNVSGWSRGVETTVLGSRMSRPASGQPVSRIHMGVRIRHVVMGLLSREGNMVEVKVQLSLFGSLSAADKSEAQGACYAFLVRGRLHMYVADSKMHSPILCHQALTHSAVYSTFPRRCSYQIRTLSSFHALCGEIKRCSHLGCRSFCLRFFALSVFLAIVRKRLVLSQWNSTTLLTIISAAVKERIR